MDRYIVKEIYLVFVIIKFVYVFEVSLANSNIDFKFYGPLNLIS
jgi:hypothetical protein